MATQLSTHANTHVTQAPAYLVGPGVAGQWIALETHGLGGGIFRTREAAFDFATFETARRPGAVVSIEGPLRLVMSS